MALPRIETWNTTDEVGTVRGDDGRTYRFGRSACNGFQPRVDLEVVVEESQPHPLGGLRATRLGCPSAVEPLRIATPAGQTAGICRGWAWAIAPLADGPPRSPEDLATWVREVGLEAEGFRVRVEKSLVVLSFGDRDVGTLFFGDGAFPEEALDDVLLPSAYQPGVGFVGLSPCEPSRVRFAVISGQAPDLWGEHGIVRVATRAALCLAQHSGVIIMPQARAAREASEFARFVAGYDRLDCRPFGGWLWWSVDDEFSLYRSYGMALFGLPDIEVPADITNAADLDRALDALLFAASTMIWRGWDLEVGSTLDVPSPANAGPTAPLPPSGPYVRYRVHRRALTEADIDVFGRHGRDQQAGWLVLQAE